MTTKLSEKRKDELETAAMSAFLANPSKLVNGIRFYSRDKKQIAAVYWSDNAPDNDVEIALCESRLTDLYPPATVHAWLDYEKRNHPSECNIHKHGSEWPIIGFKYSDALAFLKRCLQLRKGVLQDELLRSVQAFADAQPAEAAKDKTAQIVLSGLLPQSHREVIDLVSQAGVDVSDWYRKKDGSDAVAPRSNPNFCYNWAFGGGDQPAVICLWHSDLTIHDGNIMFSGNMREHGKRLWAIAENTGEAADVRSRARSQGERARQLDKLLYDVWRAERPVRVIIVEGQRRADESLGKESSIVRRRKLDTAKWYLHEYAEQTGEIRLLRDVQASTTAEILRYVDQFTETAVPKREGVVSSFVRKKSVRDNVLSRARGICELCGAPGFTTVNGDVYLETHHVVPLSENGPDHERNVVALCPNDHREAHFGIGAVSIRATLLQKLNEFYQP